MGELVTDHPNSAIQHEGSGLPVYVRMRVIPFMPEVDIFELVPKIQTGVQRTRI